MQSRAQQYETPLPAQSAKCCTLSVTSTIERWPEFSLATVAPSFLDAGHADPAFIRSSKSPSTSFGHLKEDLQRTMDARRETDILHLELVACIEELPDGVKEIVVRLPKAVKAERQQYNAIQQRHDAERETDKLNLKLIARYEKLPHGAKEFGLQLPRVIEAEREQRDACQPKHCAGPLQLQNAEEISASTGQTLGHERRAWEADQQALQAVSHLGTIVHKLKAAQQSLDSEWQRLAVDRQALKEQRDAANEQFAEIERQKMEAENRDPNSRTQSRVVGTHAMPFQEVLEREMMAGGRMQHSQSITFQECYRGHSFEELRVEDYAQGRRFDNRNAQGCVFSKTAASVPEASCPQALVSANQPVQTSQSVLESYASQFPTVSGSPVQSPSPDSSKRPLPDSADQADKAPKQLKVDVNTSWPNLTCSNCHKTHVKCSAEATCQHCRQASASKSCSYRRCRKGIECTNRQCTMFHPSQVLDAKGQPRVASAFLGVTTSASLD
ncbi:hypothetical protein BAUCODRAFT_464566 [Baudoinia panamericana UAMH 10762]|uniref:Zn(2)-C6 fungal-type domain-containing protein n=1 Tax=Baudoinia panamericana (strain UAMH 10762) TaxID=717646 RepID=M2MX63_BAUPA|nr:uncharacterized protein BAUCODRAFT_464566 [Baudoinia panamericana UAMH 10762]EMC96138.1 hypothetical protein BAUCODRAFT_464566 [Baudoinia panamericana UAMH 10762]